VSGGLCAQRLHALHSQHLFAKDLPDVPCRLVRYGFQVRQLHGRLDFALQAGHRMIGNAAGNDEREVAQIGGDVKGEAVRRNAARNVDPDGADFPLRSCGRQAFGLGS